MFFNSLLFCCMSLASMNVNIKLENLRDTDSNTINQTSVYWFSGSFEGTYSYGNFRLKAQGSKLLDVLAKFEGVRVWNIEKEYDPSITRSISEYLQQVQRTLGINASNDSDSESDSDSDTDTKSIFARCCRSKNKDN